MKRRTTGSPAARRVPSARRDDHDRATGAGGVAWPASDTSVAHRNQGTEKLDILGRA